MMGKKKLAEIKAEVAALLAKLPGPSPSEWLNREIETAKGNRDRDVETLKMLRAALEQEARKPAKVRNRRTRPA